MCTADVVGWSLSNMMDTRFCIDALKLGMGLHVQKSLTAIKDANLPVITGRFLSEWNIKISMTGKGRYID
jgi:hypothetical protein